MKCIRPIVTYRAYSALFTIFAQFKKGLVRLRICYESHIYRCSLRVSSGRSTYIFIVGFGPPPIVDDLDAKTFLFKLLDQLDGVECVFPSILIRVNQLMHLA